MTVSAMRIENRLNDSIVVYLRPQGREETDKNAVTQNHLSGIQNDIHQGYHI